VNTLIILFNLRFFNHFTPAGMHAEGDQQAKNDFSKPYYTAIKFPPVCGSSIILHLRENRHKAIHKTAVKHNSHLSYFLPPNPFQSAPLQLFTCGKMAPQGVKQK
jgi:hypothetical protein